ncbi:ROK family protein [Natrononativus amylolyticus]|uniref:ROK family protein n=1 Tax=Natrononativus amylolyticus TaxID=2963434 RepID=UPI0020CC8A30|nr:ROK family protein [Natrononativus amylolyticus]
MDLVALFGIGSTNFHYTIGTPAGDFVTAVSTEPTQPHRLEDQLLETVAELQTTESLDAVAISAPGLVDPEAGCIRKFDTADGAFIDRIDLREPIERTFDLPVYLENDCSASALGEWYFGRRGEYDCVLHLTFGTGIGGGVVEHGTLLRGDSGQAGEFGLVSVDPGSDLESDGVPGAWEAFCSGRGIPEYVAHRLEGEDWAATDSELVHTAVTTDERLSAPDVFAAAAAGDEFARSCLERLGRYNAVGVGALCNAYNPGLVTVGGGVALNNPDWLLEGLEAHLDRFCFVDRPSIEITPLGEEIGLYGALGTFMDREPGVVHRPVSKTSD